MKCWDQAENTVSEYINTKGTENNYFYNFYKKDFIFLGREYHSESKQENRNNLKCLKQRKVNMGIGGMSDGRPECPIGSRELTQKLVPEGTIPSWYGGTEDPRSQTTRWKAEPMWACPEKGIAERNGAMLEMLPQTAL